MPLMMNMTHLLSTSCKLSGYSATDKVLAFTLMIVVETRGEFNPKETKAQLTTTAGALDMRGFD